MKKAYLLTGKQQTLLSVTLQKYIESFKMFEAVRESTYNSSTLVELLPNIQDHDFIFLLDVDDKYTDCVLKIREYCQAKIVVIMKNSLLDSYKIKLFLENHSVGVLNLKSHINSLSECIDTLLTRDYYMCDFTKDWVINNIIEGKTETTFKNFNTNELTILDLAKKGYNIDMTAEEMNLSRNTIAAYRSKMLRKANAKSFSELVYLSSKEEKNMSFK